MVVSIQHLAVNVTPSDGYDAIPLTRRVAVAVEADILSVATLAGQALDVRLLHGVLGATVMTADFLAECVRKHRARTHPYAVEARVGMSGRVDYILRFQGAADLADSGMGSRVHVSMAGKLNEGLSVTLMDLPPLLAAVYAAHPQIAPGTGYGEPGRYTLREVTPFQPLGNAWAVAGDESDVYQELLTAPDQEHMTVAGDVPAATANRANSPVPALLTVAWLQQMGACVDGVNAFAAAFPDGLDISDRERARDAASRAGISGLYVNWFRERVQI